MVISTQYQKSLRFLWYFPMLSLLIQFIFYTCKMFQCRLATCQSLSSHMLLTGVCKTGQDTLVFRWCPISLQNSLHFAVILGFILSLALGQDKDLYTNCFICVLSPMRQAVSLQELPCHQFLRQSFSDRCSGISLTAKVLIGTQQITFKK